MAYTALPELVAMQQVAEIVDGLTDAERRRVGLWLVEYTSQKDASAEPAMSARPIKPATSTLPADSATSVDASYDPYMGQSYSAAPVASAASVPASTPTQAAAPATFADIYAAVAPRKGAQKAAVAGWWLETVGGQTSWKASEVNKLLKSVGVKVSSMSIVLTNAVKAKVPLVVELGRLGDSERSRKTFCLSDAGRSYVESALA